MLMLQNKYFISSCSRLCLHCVALFCIAISSMFYRVIFSSFKNKKVLLLNFCFHLCAFLDSLHSFQMLKFYIIINIFEDDHFNVPI